MSTFDLGGANDTHELLDIAGRPVELNKIAIRECAF